MVSASQGPAARGQGTADETSARDAALQQVMLLFWARGAETASYNEIVQASGLSRKALYAHWPDKGALLRETLQLYRRDVLDSVLQPLQAGGRKGLADFWRRLEAAARGRSWRGCYLFRTGTGPLRGDSFVSAALNDYLDAMSAAIAEQVRAGQATGEIDASLDAGQIGWQVAAINSLISAIGAQNGYDARVKRLFATARAVCGLAG